MANHSRRVPKDAKNYIRFKAIMKRTRTSKEAFKRVERRLSRIKKKRKKWPLGDNLSLTSQRVKS